MRRRFNMTLTGLCCSFLTVVPAAAWAQTPPIAPLAPSGPWSVDYAENGCTLARNFGSGASILRLSILQSAAPTQASVALSGAGLAGLNRPSGLLLANADHQSTTQYFLPVPQMPDGTPGYSGAIESITWAVAEVRNVTAEVRDGTRPLARLMLDQFGPAMAALRTCQRNLWQHRGFDVDTLARVHVQAEPDGSPARWVTTDDLPRAFYGMPNPLTVAAWLHLGVDGRPTRCDIGQSSGEELLDLQTCRLFMARARFTPARDSEGQPVATIVQHRVRWQSPPRP